MRLPNWQASKNRNELLSFHVINVGIKKYLSRAINEIIKFKIVTERINIL